MLARTLVVALVAAFLVGCGGDRDRGINRDRDRPKTGPPEKEKPKDKALRAAPTPAVA